MLNFLELKYEPIDIRKWIDLYNNGKFNKNNLDGWLCSGWVNWTCPEEELLPRLKIIASIITNIDNDELLSNYSLSFINYRNNKYPSFDIIRFNPLDIEYPYFFVECYNIQNDHRFILYSERNEYNMEIYADTKEELIESLNSFEALPY